MADSLRSDSYIKCLEDFLNNSKNANFVIEEIDKQAKTANQNPDTANNIFSRKQYFKNGVIIDYIYEVLHFASKNSLFKTFTSITHERRVLLKYKIIAKGFINKFRQEYPDDKTSNEELLRLFKVDFKEQIKQAVKLIHYFKFVKKRKVKFDHLINELQRVTNKCSNPNISPQLKKSYIEKISRLNRKHQYVFMNKKTNILEEFQTEINEYFAWLTSDLDFFKITKTDFGFLSVFVSRGENDVGIITLDQFEPLIHACMDGLTYYKKVMDDYGYKISNDKSCAATAINTKPTSNTCKLCLSSKKIVSTNSKKLTNNSDEVQNQ